MSIVFAIQTIVPTPTTKLIITAASAKAKIEKTIHAQTRWVVVTIAAGIGILATVQKFF